MYTTLTSGRIFENLVPMNSTIGVHKRVAETYVQTARALS